MTTIFFWGGFVNIFSRHESPLYDSSNDKDVEIERGRVLGGMTPNDILLLYNLRKSYQNNIVVKNICLGIKAGEVYICVLKP